MSDEIKLDQGTRTAFWYVIEEAFGGEMHDPHMGDVFWSHELQALEERVRKRLRLLKLGTGGNVPKLLQTFIIETATTDQLLKVAEEAVNVGLLGGLNAGQVQTLKSGIEHAFKEGGLEVQFDASGRFVRGAGVDTGPNAIAELPTQAQFKADLAAQAGHQIGLVFVDLDNFKTVNDAKGHPAGDACLANVVEIIGGCIAGKGKLYRYGGDEFTVILQNADVKEAAATAERIRRSTEAAKPGGEIEVTASLGVASSDQTGHDAEKLLEAADRAAYLSKAKGKNQVTPWGADGETQSIDQRPIGERIKRLVDLAEFGVHNIQNDPQIDSAEALSERRHAWEAEVLEALADARASQSDLSWFRVIGTYTPKGLPGTTPPHAKIVNEVAEKIDRLRRIIERLEQRMRGR